MSARERRRPALLRMAVWLTCAPIGVGCGSTEVGVGEAMVRLDLSSCYGDGIRCERPRPRAVLDAPTIASCEQSALPPHQLAWEATGWLGEYWAAALGSDQSLWLASAEGKLRLMRHDAQGGVVMPHVEHDLLGDNFHVGTEHISLAVNASNHGFVALTLSVTERNGWLHHTEHVVLEVDEEGVQVGERIEIEGVTGKLIVEVAADDALLLSGTGEDGVAVLGKLGVDRQVAWVQTGLPHASASHLLSDDVVGTLVMGSAAGAEPFHLDDSVALLDDFGNLAWEARLGTSFGSVVRHADGSVVASGKALTSDAATTPDLLAYKLSAAGELVWSRHLSSVYAWGATADGQGNTLVGSSSRLVRLDPDGACTSREVESLITTDLQALHYAPDGTLYFVTFQGSAGVIAP